MYAIILSAALAIGRLPAEPSFYNDARVIYHALGPVARSELEGIDPGKSIDVLDSLLEDFINSEKDLTEETIFQIRRLQRSLRAAKIRYWSCNGLVSQADEEKVRQIATDLSQEVQGDLPLLFIGGHYFLKDGSMKGHTATYEVIREENGNFRFIVNNTLPDEHHTIEGNKIYQLTYADLTPNDLNTSFWENVIRTNYIDPPKGKLMGEFYTYVDERLKNKSSGRTYPKQAGYVCAWESLTVWLSGHLDEKTYIKFQKFMFKTFLAHFHPNDSFKTTVKVGDLSEPAAVFLDRELKRKIEELESL